MSSQPTSAPSRPHRDDPAELQRYLSAYQPSGMTAVQWASIAASAISLVTRAGVLTRLRVEKDIQALGAAFVHLIATGRPVTVDEALSDTTLLSFDLDLRRSAASTKTRENRRGILRRLQAVHHGVPWRASRREDGARVALLVPPSTAEHLLRVLDAAERSHHRNAQALIDAVASARADRCAAGSVTTDIDPVAWAAARRFADAHGLRLTKPILTAITTHEVLNRPSPLVVLIAEHGLTRRDLDLGMTHTQMLHQEQRAALRGT